MFRRAEGGSENGASWYSKNSPREVLGSLKDFSYLFTNNLELDLELEAGAGIEAGTGNWSWKLKNNWFCKSIVDN